MYACHFEYSCMGCSGTTENNQQSDKKEILMNSQDNKYDSMKHFETKQLLFTKTRILRVKCLWKSTVKKKNLAGIISLRLLGFKPISQCLLFFKLNSRQDRFLSSSRSKLSKDIFKFCMWDLTLGITNKRKARLLSNGLKMKPEKKMQWKM